MYFYELILRAQKNRKAKTGKEPTSLERKRNTEISNQAKREYFRMKRKLRIPAIRNYPSKFNLGRFSAYMHLCY